MQNLFPSVEPSPEFRAQLKLKILTMYEHQQKPSFNWRWLMTPSIIISSLLLVILLNNQSAVSNLEHQLSLQPNSEDDQTTQQIIDKQQVVEDATDSEYVQLAENSANLEELDRELSELANDLNSDTDLEAAIIFSNL